jgi:hypothetical protein
VIAIAIGRVVWIRALTFIVFPNDAAAAAYAKAFNRNERTSAKWSI